MNKKGGLIKRKGIEDEGNELVRDWKFLVFVVILSICALIWGLVY